MKPPRPTSAKGAPTSDLEDNTPDVPASVPMWAGPGVLSSKVRFDSICVKSSTATTVILCYRELILII